MKHVSRDIAPIFLPFRQPSSYKIATGGRSSSKSWFFAAEAVEHCYTKGWRILCCREIQKSIKESVYSLIVGSIERMGLSDDFHITNNDIVCLRNGGRFAFAGLRTTSGGSNADNIKSYEDFDCAYVEEAQNISKASLDILLPTIRKPGSEIWFSMNPKTEDDAVLRQFVKPFAEVVPAGTIHIHANYMHNPWCPEKMIELAEACRAKDIDEYNHIWLGQVERRASKAVFKDWCVEEFEPNEHVKFYYGIDFGYWPDPTCAGRCWINWEEMRIYIDYAVFARQIKPSQIGTNVMDKIPGSRDALWMADSARNDLIKELDDGYWRVDGAEKPPGSIEKGVDFLRNFEVVIHPRCCIPYENEEDLCLEYELKHYSHKVDSKTEKILPDIEDKFNHCIDQIRYALSLEILREGSVDNIALMRAAANKVKQDAERKRFLHREQSKLNSDSTYIKKSSPKSPGRYWRPGRSLMIPD